MVRKLALVLATSVPVWAQFSELATTDDGAQLYFTSELRLTDDAQVARTESRLYRHVGQIELFQERGALARRDAAGSGDGVRNVQVSGDGQTVGFSMYNVCPAENPCMRTIVQAEIRGRGASVLGEGTLFLSRNAEWALLTPPRFGPGAQDSSVLINVRTGERTTVPLPAAENMPLASDGTLIVRRPESGGHFALGLWRNGEFLPLAIPESIRLFALSDNGGTLVFSRVSGMPGMSAPLRIQLVALNLSTRRETVVYASELTFPFFTGLSNDGRWLLYRSTSSRPEGPAFIADTQTGESWQLPLDQELASTGTLSGFGNAAFLVTTTGRIIKIGLLNGRPVAQVTLVPATPYVTVLGGLTPGSMVRLRGTLPRNAEALNGRILVDDRPMPILSVDSQEITVQVPWEAGLQGSLQSSFRLDLPSESPFRQNELVFVAPMSPRFEPSFRLIRADFSGILDIPRQPSEIVHVYMTGLGRVRGAIETGAPAPLDRLLPIEGQFRCQFSPYANPAETLFAGLAPGMIGIYQVSFRMPPDAGARITGGRCETTTGVLTFSLGSEPLP